jgi:opacity protein-like surface antigen
MTTRYRRLTVTISIVALLLAAAPAWAFDAEQTFKKGTYVLSGEGAYGWQTNLEHKRSASHVEFYDAGVRFSLLPLDTIARSSFLYGALEVGLEPLYQHYTTPKQAFWAGLAAVLRYHFLGLGRVVPYAELGGGAGGTDLEVREINSTLAFLVFGGLGASIFVSNKTALYAGYRYQHVSNGNTSQPNRGFESNVGVAGISFFFP